MNYLNKLSRDMKRQKSKQKLNSINRFTALAVVGVSIGGVVLGLFARNCLSEIKNIIIDNAKDSDVDENEELKVKRDEIKQTLYTAPVKSVGDVGVAMEKALEDLEDEKENENEVEK